MLIIILFKTLTEESRVKIYNEIDSDTKAKIV